ncbi:cell wall protein IFF6-like [Drosophila miranda]|uniref:cell wall protein IFF6-like n=1 Tax=Drosophila miranda TaxID=7229 RepID=UPI00143FB221|nr:cell wall protein IFF6-like [Drosophila miranda]
MNTNNNQNTTPTKTTTTTLWKLRMLLHPNCTQSTFPPNLHTRLQPDSKPDHAHANSNANTHPTRSPDQSGFDNSGHGYYVATDEDDGDMRTRGNGNGNGYAYSRPPQSLSSPSGRLAGNCPYGGGSKVSSSAISSESSRGGGHTSVLGSDAGIKPNGQGSWTYLGDQDKSEGSGSSSGGSNGGGSGSSGSASMSSGSSRDRERERDRDRDAQSSSYGGRPRPLGVSYLLEAIQATRRVLPAVVVKLMVRECPFPRPRRPPRAIPARQWTMQGNSSVSGTETRSCPDASSCWEWQRKV